MKNKRMLKLNNAGFTLIELMVVIVILGILAMYIGPKIMGRPDEAKQVKARMDIASLETALKLYKLDLGSYPADIQELVTPPATENSGKWRKGGYLEKSKVPNDPWDYEYIYRSPGVNGDFDIVSYGADGVQGGEGKDRDINNWDVE
ncbi:type II secretion system major pseudopilin GspG [Desulfococcaceae bacterium HSG9]|nr:type II secretion system major pseudopilin GspG [Desulfococcaceae bacterium HSG9]